MATTKCGWCGTNTHYTGTVVDTRNQKGEFEAHICDECNGVIVSFVEEVGREEHPLGIGQMINYRTTWAPAFVEGQEFPDVPPHIADAASEAHKSRSIKNLKSTILMARTVVEATAKEKGVTKGSLFQKVDEMHTLGLIQELTKATAHGIRDFGNDMAHGDIKVPVDEADAEVVLEFMDAFLAEVFQTPAKLAALQATIAARKQSKERA